ncbi:MAG: BamA/TamA family outer membrane protein, partial [Candidatus Sericytochromatia bacterium]
EFSASGTGKDFLVMPKIGLNFNDLDSNTNPKSGEKFGASLGVGTGSATFGQADANYKKYIPLSNDKKWVMSLGVSGGVQAGNVPYYEKYNSFNTTSVYGRASDGKERDTYYAVGSANLKYNVWGPVSLIAGTTVGGIGHNMSDLGVGGGVEVNLMGIPISVTAGARYNPITKESGTAINVNILKLDF